MDVLFDFLQEYGSYIALPLVINFIVQWTKTAFVDFFTSHWGQRLLTVAPLLLGLAGGFLLPNESLMERLLVGGALGTLSQTIYEFVTKGLATKTILVERAARKSMVDDVDE